MTEIDPTVGVAFVQAAHVSQGSNLPVTRIVIHGTVSPTFVGSAAQVAQYFTSPAAGGSAQYVVDPGTIIQCVAESAIAWHAPPNQGSIGWEFCDMVAWDPAYPNGFPNEAAWHGRWTLPLWDAMLRLGAAGVRANALKYGVPLIRINSARLLAGQGGICGHIDVSNAWHQTNHTDPGPDFPWDTFMSYVITPPNQPAPPVLDLEDEIMAMTPAERAAFISDIAQAVADQPIKNASGQAWPASAYWRNASDAVPGEVINYPVPTGAVDAAGKPVTADFWTLLMDTHQKMAGVASQVAAIQTAQAAQAAAATTSVKP